MAEERRFQFHKVQLKVVRMSIIHNIAVEFQFHKVQLKASHRTYSGMK